MRAFLPLPRCLLFLSCFAASFGSAAIQMERGTIDGAHYAIAREDTLPWNESILIIAHGYRPETAPLVADLYPEQAAYATLLSEGWIVAKTSYRRNGIIVADAITDLDNLHDHIVAIHGQPQRVILEGDSMGGTIAVHLMESANVRYHGAVAVGSALHLRETPDSPGVTNRPRGPLLFLSNRSEIDGPLAYEKKTVMPSRAQFHPAVFRVDRDGHVNVNQAERLFALRALNRWLDDPKKGAPDSNQRGQAPLDATHAPVPSPSQVEFDSDGRGFTARVTHISAIYGNVWLNAQPSDMTQLGLPPGQWAQLHIGDQIHPVRHGKDFSSVEQGQWVLFPNADGYFWLSRNYANAAATANLQLGDKIHLRLCVPVE
jgi:pimeloyl-ACP methyl ester carboxylesterase